MESGIRVLALGGGGVKGAYQAGFLHAQTVENVELDYDMIVGTSIGAVGGGILASGYSGPNGFRDKVLQYGRLWTVDVRESKDVFERRWLGWLSGYFKMSLYKTTPLRDLLERHVDQDAILDSGRMLRVGVWNATRDAYIEVREDSEVLREMIRASAAFPVFLEPVYVGDEVFADGGVRNNVPNLFLNEPEIRGKIDSIDIILTGPIRGSDGHRVELNNAKDMAARVIGSFMNEANVNDLLPYLNYLYAHPDCRIRITAPPLPLEADTLGVDQGKMRRMFEQGKRARWYDFMQFFQDFVLD